MNTFGTKVNIIKKVVGLLFMGILLTYEIAMGAVLAAIVAGLGIGWLCLELFVSVRRYRRNHAV